jgi:uncharacterized repeat protein (TIGR03803 family)
MWTTVRHRGRSWGVGLGAAKGVLVLATVLMPAVGAPRPAQEPGETPTASVPAYSVLYTFGQEGPDGCYPFAGVVRDPAGNLYGTTINGGASGWGTVFKLDATGKETVLYSFTGGADGSEPFAGLVRDAAGNLYGTTASGGTSPFGNGVVFKLDTTGKETVLYTFTGGADGGEPFAALVKDAAGNLYGTTIAGGAFGQGTVFKLDTTGKETVLHSFDGSDGAYPSEDLTRDAAGNLYGTTLFVAGGGLNYGVVFKLDTAGKETVLHSFRGYPADGAFSVYGTGRGLVRDAAGDLYGTTDSGGAFNDGLVFRVNTTGKETVLYSFTGGLDGGNPSVGLVRDAAGNLYGTAVTGGADDCGDDGCGVVFKLDPTGRETVLHSFAPGAVPNGSLVRDSRGNLYGTSRGPGCGCIFKVAP